MKIMKKVKSQWVAVSKFALAVAAVTTVAVGSNLIADATSDTANEVSTEQASENSVNDQEAVETESVIESIWKANTVEEVAKAIEEQKASGKSLYEIVTGDTLWAMSQATGISVAELAKLNGIVNPDLIFAGANADAILTPGVMVGPQREVFAPVVGTPASVDAPIVIAPVVNTPAVVAPVVNTPVVVAPVTPEVPVTPVTPEVPVTPERSCNS